MRGILRCRRKNSKRFAFTVVRAITETAEAHVAVHAEKPVLIFWKSILAEPIPKTYLIDGFSVPTTTAINMVRRHELVTRLPTASALPAVSSDALGLDLVAPTLAVSAAFL